MVISTPSRPVSTISLDLGQLHEFAVRTEYPEYRMAVAAKGAGVIERDLSRVALPGLHWLAGVHIAIVHIPARGLRAHALRALQ
jgi:hypothetical protein